MKILLDFLPVILFFVAYKTKDILFATGVLMVATVLQMGYLWLKHRKLDNPQKITLVAVLAFGALTLAFRNEAFIQWKVTVVNVLFGIAFLLSPLFDKGQPLIKRMMGGFFDLSDKAWHRLNGSWVAFFVGCGILNVFVFKNFDNDAWVNFKLFGLMGLTFVFLFGQIFLLRNHLTPEPEVEGAGEDKAEPDASERRWAR